MPQRPLKPCNHPGCSALVRGVPYCDSHRKQSTRYNEQFRQSSNDRGYDARWRKARLMYLKKFTLCAECLKQERIELATDVDHIKPHKGDYEMFWDQRNWQSLCHSCHSRKTARERLETQKE